MKTNFYPSESEIKQILERPESSFGNRILYEMCEKEPEHNDLDVVIGKIWLIGRAYSASIERRKKDMVKEINDNFYDDYVGPIMIKAKFDDSYNKLNRLQDISDDNMEIILNVHNKLMKIFKEMSGLDKRSLSSKYLHFHKSNLFFIYDSRVVSAIGHLKRKVPVEFEPLINNPEVDKSYANFFIKAYILKKEFEEICNKKIRNRQFDTILIKVANKANRKKNNK